jgi:hypothetical protein
VEKVRAGAGRTLAKATAATANAAAGGTTGNASSNAEPRLVDPQLEGVTGAARLRAAACRATGLDRAREINDRQLEGVAVLHGCEQCEPRFLPLHAPK